MLGSCSLLQRLLHGQAGRQKGREFTSFSKDSHACSIRRSGRACQHFKLLVCDECHVLLTHTACPCVCVLAAMTTTITHGLP